MSGAGQKAKYSLRADVFRCSPNIGHAAQARVRPVEAVLLHSANARMRPVLLSGSVT